MSEKTEGAIKNIDNPEKYVRENWRGNQEWIIQKNKQPSTQDRENRIKQNKIHNTENGKAEQHGPQKNMGVNACANGG